MSRHLQRDLDSLQHNLLMEASLVEEAIHKAIQALQNHDRGLAREVIAGDPRIDQEENHVEDKALKILALHQPVAIDLRRIAAAIKINTDLERMADLAEHVAERVLHLPTLPMIPIRDKLRAMADLTTSMVRECLDSFVNLDTVQARRICRLDDEVDRLNRDIIDELVQLMQDAPDKVEWACR